MGTPCNMQHSKDNNTLDVKRVLDYNGITRESTILLNVPSYYSCGVKN